MLFFRNIYKKEYLLSMLDFVIGYCVENDLCDFCLVKENKSEFCLKNSDLCKSFIFEGLAKNAEKQGGKNAHK